jgi:SSS family solute:Na+ symporter/cation/acetate symporter
VIVLDDSTQMLSLMAFLTVVTVTLLLCVITGPDSDDLEEFYTGRRSPSPRRNGVAIAGDYISAATVLGGGGVIALAGHDGIVIALSTMLSLLFLMFVLAEPLRNAGRFMMSDALAGRMPGRSVRIAACATTLLTLMPLMLVQLAGVGELLPFLLGFQNEDLKTACIIGMGGLMIAYAAIGAMKGTALIQTLKIFVLIGSGLVVSLLILRRFDWDPGALLTASAARAGVGDAFLHAGGPFATGPSPTLDIISGQLTVVLGSACLPHVTMRLYTVTSARQARRSLSWAVSLVAVFMLILMVVSLGATALVGGGAIKDADPHGNTAYLIGSRAVLGQDVSIVEMLLLTTVATALFLTVLASVGGMIVSCANSLAHDVFGRDGARLSARREIASSQLSAVAIGIVAISLAVLVHQRNLQPLATLSFCLGASALAPALLYSLYWRRYTRVGLMSTLIGGAVSVLVLMTGTNLVSGSPTAAFPDHDFNWFPFTTTGLVSVPLGFALGWLGTVLSGRRRAEEARRRYATVEEQILTGRVRE